MKRLISAGFILTIVLIIVLAGCTGGKREFGYYLYTANEGNNTISGFIIQPDTGALAQIGTGALYSGYQPGAINSHPSGNFLYAVNKSTPNQEIMIYNINPTTGELNSKGSITINFPSSYPSLPDYYTPKCLTFCCFGRFLCTANESQYNITLLNIYDDGNLKEYKTYEEKLPSTNYSNYIIFHPSNSFAYTANYSMKSITEFRFDPKNGEFIPIKAPHTIPNYNQPNTLVIDSTGRYVYAVGDIGGGTANYISVFQINPDGTLMDIQQFVTSFSQVNALAMDPTGKYLYISNNFDINCSITGYNVDAVTGRLTQMTNGPSLNGEFTTGNQPAALIIDPTGRYLYTANKGSCDISAFTIDPVTGCLTEIAGSPFSTGTSPSALTIVRVLK